MLLFLTFVELASPHSSFGGCLACLVGRRKSTPRVLRSSSASGDKKAIEMTFRLKRATLNPLDDDYTKAYLEATTKHLANLQACVISQSGAQVNPVGAQAIAMIEGFRSKKQILIEEITISAGYPALITVYTTV